MIPNFNEPKYAVNQPVYYLFENDIHHDRIERIILAGEETEDEEHSYFLKYCRRMIYEYDLFDDYKSAKKALIKKFKK